MKKATVSVLIFVFASLLASFQSFAQDRRMITENLYRNVRAQEQLRLPQVFRLYPEEARSMEISSLIITARGYQGRTQIQILQHGRVLLGGLIGAQTTTLRLPFPQGTRIQDLVLASRGDLYIETLSAEVRYNRRPSPLPRPERVYIRQTLHPHTLLELGRVLPYENRLVRSITIEAYTRYAPGAQLQLTTGWGEVIGSIRVSPSPMRPRIQLHYPMALRELQIRSVSPVPIEIEALEFEFDRSPY